MMSDFNSIGIKFSTEVEIDKLNYYLKFGCDQLISCPIEAGTKKFS